VILANIRAINAVVHYPSCVKVICACCCQLIRYVSVQDVALAHIRAAELQSARGRYFLSASEASLPGGQIVDILQVRLMNGVTLLTAVMALAMHY
jgi:hypothetical protein